jgi:diguanylate cyclase (GGDEF)-like protein/PAS domain S-box-containing protein
MISAGGGSPIVADEQSLLSEAFANAPVAMAVADLDLRVLRTNARFDDYLGSAGHLLVDGTLTVLVSPVREVPGTPGIDALRAGSISSYELEKPVPGPAGPRWLLITVGLVRGPTGWPARIIVQAHDITAGKRREQRLGHLADHDDLTGVFNRRRFRQELDDQIEHVARYGGAVGSLALLDLDGFKGVNDTLGHQAGDEVLRFVARTLAGRLRINDVLGRIGGDEFAVILPHASGDEACILVGDLLTVVRETVITAAGRTTELTMSAGIVLADQGPARELLTRADAALYTAKAAGGDRYQLLAGWAYASSI